MSLRLKRISQYIPGDGFPETSLWMKFVINPVDGFPIRSLGMDIWKHPWGCVFCNIPGWEWINDERMVLHYLELGCIQ